MRRRALWPRLVGVFVGLLVGVYYIGVQILGWDFEDDTYQVGLSVPRAAGLFDGSEVTYRGVRVGQVAQISLTPGDVSLSLELDQAVEIPADSTARVRMLSALGENYVDLTPGSGAAGVLREGDTLATATVPVPVGDALGSAQRLLDSVDPDDIETLQTFLAAGFTDVGPELKTLVRTGNELTNAFIEAAPATEATIRNGRTVLETANATSDDLTRIITAFNTLSAQFVASDDDFATLINDGGEAATQIESLVRQQTGPFRRLLQGTGRIGVTIEQHEQALRLMFALLPSVSTSLAGVADGDHLRGTLSLNLDQPLCTFGALPLPGVDNTRQGRCPPGPGGQQRGPDQ